MSVIKLKLEELKILENMAKWFTYNFWLNIYFNEHRKYFQ